MTNRRVAIVFCIIIVSFGTFTYASYVPSDTRYGEVVCKWNSVTGFESNEFEDEFDFVIVVSPITEFHFRIIIDLNETQLYVDTVTLGEYFMIKIGDRVTVKYFLFRRLKCWKLAPTTYAYFTKGMNNDSYTIFLNKHEYYR